MFAIRKCVCCAHLSTCVLDYVNDVRNSARLLHIVAEASTFLRKSIKQAYTRIAPLYWTGLVIDGLHAYCFHVARLGVQRQLFKLVQLHVACAWKHLTVSTGWAM